jgi:DDE superfamily endonuclease
VVCADESGPLNLQPRPGCAWRPAGHPVRLRATYNRTGGVRHMLAALDLATGKMIYRIRTRKRWREFLSFLKLARQRRPGQKLYLIADNFSLDKHPQVTGRAALFRNGTAVELCGLGGAFGRVLPDATAFAHQDAEVLLTVAAILPPERASRALAA